LLNLGQGHGAAQGTPEITIKWFVDDFGIQDIDTFYD
jgi:hypothetical protein